VLDLYLVYQFLRRLATPFIQWEAFKLGIIDAQGRVLRKRSSLNTRQEKAAFGVYDVMILNIKKMIENLPGGSRKLASYAAALYLIREHNAFLVGKNTLNESEEAELNEGLFFEKYLIEVLDKPYPYKWVKKTPVYYDAHFKTHEGHIISLGVSKERLGSWGVAFDRNDTTYGKRPSFSTTGQGDQYRIFATVFSIITDFIAQKSPDKLYFTADKFADGPGRAKLYLALSKKYAKKMGYSFDHIKNHDEDKFIFIKEDAPTMNVGSGNIAGLGPGEDPPMTKRAVNKYKSKNKKDSRRPRRIIGEKQ
jgi:hypothetical protein